jgi:uncharacterized protein (TIGR03435 family)
MGHAASRLEGTSAHAVAAQVPSAMTLPDLFHKAKEQVKLVLRSLLKERFKLALHTEQKDIPVFNLVVGKNGPKLKESSGGRGGVVADANQAERVRPESPRMDPWIAMPMPGTAYRAARVADAPVHRRVRIMTATLQRRRPSCPRR